MSTKGCIYYTDFHADPKILTVCCEQLKKSFDGDIVSVSLNKPLNLGKNIILENAERSYQTMVKQIIVGLEALSTDYVFFTESDVLYHKSHFDFTPPKDNIFYYDENTWRWWIGSDKAIRHDRMLSLSSLYANREFTLNHYKRRQEKIKEKGWDKITGGEPEWARAMGYEPGTKKKKRGGFSDDDFDIWNAECPSIDIRHEGTFSNPKTKIEHFKHKPKWFKEIDIDKIDSWNLRKLFNL